MIPWGLHTDGSPKYLQYPELQCESGVLMHWSYGYYTGLPHSGGGAAYVLQGPLPMLTSPLWRPPPYVDTSTVEAPCLCWPLHCGGPLSMLTPALWKPPVYVDTSTVEAPCLCLTPPLWKPPAYVDSSTVEAPCLCWQLHCGSPLPMLTAPLWKPPAYVDSSTVEAPPAYVDSSTVEAPCLCWQLHCGGPLPTMTPPLWSPPAYVDTSTVEAPCLCWHLHCGSPLPMLTPPLWKPPAYVDTSTVEHQWQQALGVRWPSHCQIRASSRGMHCFHGRFPHGFHLRWVQSACQIRPNCRQCSLACSQWSHWPLTHSTPSGEYVNSLASGKGNSPSKYYFNIHFHDGQQEHFIWNALWNFSMSLLNSQEWIRKCWELLTDYSGSYRFLEMFHISSHVLLL